MVDHHLQTLIKVAREAAEKGFDSCFREFGNEDDKKAYALLREEKIQAILEEMFRGSEGPK